MDFSLVMLLLLVATGLVWGLDRWLWAPARGRAAEAMRRAGGTDTAAETIRKEPVAVEYARAFFPVILVVFLLRSFLAEPFRIPSGSMLPSLFIGDFILVNKFAYGIRLPVINVKLIPIGNPGRGEVAVFRFPGDPSINYIKRVVGLPGDRIEYRDKRLYVNGKPFVQKEPRPYVLPSSGEIAADVTRLTEVAEGVEHDILMTGRPEPGPTEFSVPEGHYFVMGDNRDHSNDSRYWGYVPDGNLVGRAFLIWFSWDMTAEHKWFWERIVWSRIGSAIH